MRITIVIYNFFRFTWRWNRLRVPKRRHATSSTRSVETQKPKSTKVYFVLISVAKEVRSFCSKFYFHRLIVSFKKPECLVRTNTEVEWSMFRHFYDRVAGTRIASPLTRVSLFLRLILEMGKHKTASRFFHVFPLYIMLKKCALHLLVIHALRFLLSVMTGFDLL